jgi:hypothetical protein
VYDLGYNTAMILELLRWWYGPGWMQTIHRIGVWTGAVEHTFAVSTLLRTWFAPWRRIITVSGRGIDAHIRAALDNFVSRCIGGIIRTFVLLAAAIASFFAFVAGVVMMVIWPFIPLAGIYFLVRSVTG